MKRQSLLTAALLVLAAGCASISRHPVLEKLVEQAQIPGLPGARNEYLAPEWKAVEH